MPVDIPGEFKPTLSERFWIWAGSKTSARVDELATNTSYADSFKLFDRIGDVDHDETEIDNATRWSRLSTLRKMYKGESKRGNQLAGAITDFHAALQFGQGIRLKDEASDDPDKPSPAFEAFREFMDVNDLSDEGLIDLGVSGELDGQVLLRLQPDPIINQVRAWTIPLLRTRYEVRWKTNEPWTPSVAVLNPGDAQGNEEKLEKHEFVFVRFRCVKDGTYGIARVLRVLDEMEDLHEAIRDWRKINRIFASPTPVFLGKDAQAMARIKTAIVSINWKIGKAFIGMAGDEFKLVGLAGGEHASLKDEIVSHAQTISGATNVPVHYLGYPELMSNRSVADSDMEPALKATEKALKQWSGFFTETKEKVFNMLNVLHGRGASGAYNPDDVSVKFPSVRKGNIIESIKAWLPVRVSKQISHATFLEKIGIDDPEAEMQSIEREVDEFGEMEGEDESEARILAVASQAIDREDGGAAA